MTKSVCVIGLGYIGMPTACLIANGGYNVTCVDTNLNIINNLKSGNIHINESGLDTLFHNAWINKRFTFATTVIHCDVYIICVPTPFNYENEMRKPDMSHVINAVNSIKPVLRSGDLIILESTSPVGTTKYIYDMLKMDSVENFELNISYCPERVIPGNIVNELVNNDRIIGGYNNKSSELTYEFYKTFVKGNLHLTNSFTAEMCKLAENSFRDVNIAFANELSLICNNLNIDVNEVINFANFHPRVNILNPGIGVGGHCISVDPWFIVFSDPINSIMIKTARLINDNKTSWVIDKIITHINASKATINNVSIFGLSYKPDTDDLRESPAVKVYNRLKNYDFTLSAVEPNIVNSDKFNLISINQALLNSDLIIILVAHKEFKKIVETLSFEYHMNKIKILDFVNLL